MYIPKAFREDDLKTLHTLMQQYNFATLIMAGCRYNPALRAKLSMRL
jgi:predicted FMN-binding regulatory protein PaiB